MELKWVLNNKTYSNFPKDEYRLDLDKNRRTALMNIIISRIKEIMKEIKKQEIEQQIVGIDITLNGVNPTYDFIFDIENIWVVDKIREIRDSLSL